VIGFVLMHKFPQGLGGDRQDLAAGLQQIDATLQAGQPKITADKISVVKVV
jgi:hypothetical protein